MRGPAFRLLAGLFVLSGVSGLIYEIVWLRMLIRTFGVTVQAVSTILSVFMFGLALGSWLSARWARRLERPLVAYAVIEVAIGISAVISTVLMGYMPGWVSSMSLEGGGIVAARFALSGLVLIPPTMLMGATLPILSELARTDRGRASSAVGFLYAANTWGAVLGVALSGFVLLGTLGEFRSILVGAGLNLFVAVAVFAGFRRAEALPPDIDDPSPAGAASTRFTLSRLLVLYGLCGFFALSFQVVWSRLLGLLLGSSVYGFSSMLCVYLAGIAIGSAVAARYSDRIKRPGDAFAAIQALIAVLAIVSLFLLTRLGMHADHHQYLYSRLWDLGDLAALPVYSFVVVFPVTFLSGAAFPLMARLGVQSGGSVSEPIGKLYAMNTAGAILGSFVTGFLLIPVLGSVTTLAVGATMALGVSLAAWSRSDRPAPQRKRRMLVALLAFGLVLPMTTADPFLSILKARLSDDTEILSHEETASGVVTVAQAETGGLSLYINGHTVSGTGHIWRWLYGYLPAALHPDPSHNLIVGLGAGEAFTGSLELGLSTTVAELQPAVRAVQPLFRENAAELMASPRATIAMADGRNFLLHTDEMFDLILVDGSPPIFASGTVNLYTREFVQLARDHLTSDGILAIWVPLPCFEHDLWVIARNFTDIFPQVMIWGRSPLPGTYVFGSPSETALFEVTPEALAQRLEGRGVPPDMATDFAASFDSARLMTTAGVTLSVEGYEGVTDDRPSTEFPLLRFLAGETFHRNHQFLIDEVRAAGGTIR